MTPPISGEYVVAFGYSQTFRVTAEEAQALVTARENGAAVVKFGDRVFATNFTWIVPAAEIDQERLSVEELQTAETVGKWLAQPAHDMAWGPEAAMRYSKRLVLRLGSGRVRQLLNLHGNGPYPSAKRFLSEAKEATGTMASTMMMLTDYGDDDPNVGGT